MPCLTFDGLSKVQRACGYRVGWLSLTGAPGQLGEIEHALDLLASLRLCANVPGQWAIAPSLTGADTISPLTAPGGRLHETRRAVIDACAQQPLPRARRAAGRAVRVPGRAHRCCCRASTTRQFALDLLEPESVLIVPGSRLQFRRSATISASPCCRSRRRLRDVFARIERVLERMAVQRSAAGVRLREREPAAIHRRPSCQPDGPCHRNPDPDAVPRARRFLHDRRRRRAGRPLAGPARACAAPRPCDRGSPRRRSPHRSARNRRTHGLDHRRTRRRDGRHTFHPPYALVTLADRRQQPVRSIRTAAATCENYRDRVPRAARARDRAGRRQAADG